MAIHQYNMGDIVMVRPDICPGEKFGIYVNEDMTTYAGKLVVINTIAGNHGVYPAYTIQGDEYRWVWTEDLFIQTDAEITEKEYEPENLSLLYEWL